MAVIDKSRRKSLKTIASGTLALASAGSANAALSNIDTSLSGITIKVYGNVYGHTVLVSNNTAVTRRLDAVQPHKIYSADKSINLNVLFNNGSLVIPANTTQAFFVSDNGEITPHARWQALIQGEQPDYPIARIQPIEIIASATGQSSHYRVRQHLAMFS